MGYNSILTIRMRYTTHNKDDKGRKIHRGEWKMNSALKRINDKPIKVLHEYCKLYARSIRTTHLPSGTYINGLMRE